MRLGVRFGPVSPLKNKALVSVPYSFMYIPIYEPIWRYKYNTNIAIIFWKILFLIQVNK